MGTEHKMLISRNKTVTELAKDCCDRLYFWFIHQTLIIVYWLCLLVTQIFLARLFFRPSPAAPRSYATALRHGTPSPPRDTVQTVVLRLLVRCWYPLKLYSDCIRYNGAAARVAHESHGSTDHAPTDGCSNQSKSHLNPLVYSCTTVILPPNERPSLRFRPYNQRWLTVIRCLTVWENDRIIRHYWTKAHILITMTF